MADKSMAGLNTFTDQSSTPSVDASKKLRIGIIGCGWIAGAHMASYLNQPDVEIVAGADIIPGKAKAFMEKYGITNAKTEYASHKEMLEDKSLNLDAVSISISNGFIFLYVIFNQLIIYDFLVKLKWIILSTYSFTDFHCLLAT